MRDDRPDPVSVWWARVRRAAERRGQPIGTRGIMSDWRHNIMSVLDPDASGFGWELVDEGGRRIFLSEPGCRRVPITPEQLTDEYKLCETNRLTDQLDGAAAAPGGARSTREDR